MSNFQNGESDCWPVACPPIFCKHPVLLPGSCCPTCVNILPGNCQYGNESSSLQKKSCYHNGKIFRNGDIWPVVENADEVNTSRRENGCTSCKCKVRRLYFCHKMITLIMTMNLYGSGFCPLIPII